MPQIELDPRTASQDAHRDRIIAVLPPSVRAFGFVPDVEQLLPGDLILSRSPSPGLIDSQIAKSQQDAGFALQDAHWTHAAVFIGDDLIVEALPFRGIVQESIYSYIPAEIMRIRRNAGFSDAQRHRIALQAMKNLGKRYSHWSAVALGADLARGLWNKTALRTNRFVVICSQLYFDCVLEITDRRLQRCPTEQPTTRAHLSATPDLTDVNVEWLRIARA